MSGPTSDHVTLHQQLLDKIRVRSATVGVIGLGDGGTGSVPGRSRIRGRDVISRHTFR